jgi:hypothetical protein
VFGEHVQHMAEAAAPAPNPALWDAVCEGGIEEVRQLLLAGANVEEEGRDEDWEDGVERCTPLQIAVNMHEDAVDMVQLLLEHGADVSVSNTDEDTPLHDTENEAVALLLLQHRADVSARNDGGWTPLHLAAHRGREEVAKVLLENGADVSAMDNEGRTPLGIATFPARAEVMRVLLEHGADVNGKNEDGWTALHLAARLGHAEVVGLLLQHRANILAEDNDGRTAQFWATNKGHPEVVAMLQAAAVTRAKCVAFAMGHHKRLGVGSLVAPIDAEVVKMVLQLVV